VRTREDSQGPDEPHRWMNELMSKIFFVENLGTGQFSIISCPNRTSSSRTEPYLTVKKKYSIAPLKKGERYENFNVTFRDGVVVLGHVYKIVLECILVQYIKNKSYCTC
jgi:hypothetical protein